MQELTFLWGVQTPAGAVLNDEAGMEVRVDVGDQIAAEAETDPPVLAQKTVQTFVADPSYFARLPTAETQQTSSRQIRQPKTASLL